MEETPRLITVKLKKAGWEVEITCTESQLKQAIESVLSSLESKSPAQLPLTGPSQIAGESTENKTCRGLIFELWQNQWFAEARSLSDVHEEIARMGYHYDRTAVSHALTDLVRENVLTRQGYPRNYAYIQKRPPSSQPAQFTTAQSDAGEGSPGTDESE
ncbi:MAG TPA: hypothetical protein VFF30_07700 [Nitrososphaerales archaeon]|nr:hypothetical protein [Nitrososphaerales archaeon]